MDAILQYANHGWQGLGCASSPYHSSYPNSNPALSDQHPSSPTKDKPANPTTASALHRSPIEIWTKILRLTIDLPDWTRCHEEPHVFSSQSFFETGCFGFGKDLSPKLVEARDAGRILIKVCRGWRKVAGPILLEWLTFCDGEMSAAMFRQKLARTVGNRKIASYVRRLDFLLSKKVESGKRWDGRDRYPWSVKDLNRILRMCVHLEHVRWDGNVAYPEELQVARLGDTLRAVEIFGSHLQFYTIANLITSCPRLELLEVPGSQLFDKHGNYEMAGVIGSRYPLQALSMLWALGEVEFESIEFARFLARLPFPHLADLKVTYAGGAALFIQGMAPFFQSVGQTLKSLHLEPFLPWGHDDDLFVLLQFCPSLQDFIADVPEVPVSPIPPHMNLRRIGLHEFRDTCFSRPENAQFLNDYVSRASALISIICISHLPALQIIRDMDSGNKDVIFAVFHDDKPRYHEEYRKLSANVATTCANRGVSFEDSRGCPIRTAWRIGARGYGLYVEGDEDRLKRGRADRAADEAYYL